MFRRPSEEHDSLRRSGKMVNRSSSRARRVDLLESQARRVAFKIPDPKQTSGKEFQVISDLMKDVGAALESIANTLADGVVEENELNATIPKLEAVIQECASVRYLLGMLCKNRKKESEKVTRSGAFASQTCGPSSKEAQPKDDESELNNIGRESRYGAQD